MNCIQFHITITGDPMALIKPNGTLRSNTNTLAQEMQLFVLLLVRACIAIRLWTTYLCCCVVWSNLSWASMRLCVLLLRWQTAVVESMKKNYWIGDDPLLVE